MPTWAVAPLLAAVLAAPDTPSASPLEGPYKLLVCLRFSDDPIFTRFFVQSVRRQVQDQLTHYFGRVAEVRVQTDEELFARLAPDGLARLAPSPALFAGPESQGKVFLMAVDSDRGAYRIEWRQLDGDVQDVGPLGQRATPDRQWLAKALCLAVKEDFSPVAAVEPLGKGEVRLSFRGAGPDAPLAPWFAAGAVLQPFRVVRQRNGSVAYERLPYTALRIAAGGDGSRGTVVSSRSDPWQRTARVVGFRALKVGTRQGRFRLRILNVENGSPVLDCMVYASRQGFEELKDADRLLPPDRNGWVVCDRPLDVACVTIKQREDTAYQVLLPITADWVEQVLRIPADKRFREKNDWNRRLRYCVQDVQVVQGAISRAVQDVNAMVEGKRYEEALKQVKASAEAIQPLVAAAQSAAADLEREAKEIGMAGNAALASARQQCGDAVQRVGQFDTLAKDLDRTIRDINSHNRAKVLINLAGQAEAAGDVEGAIKQYEAALQETPDEAQIKKRLEDLKEAWRIKGPEHQKARDFVYQTLDKVAAKDLGPRLRNAESAFTVLSGADDRFALKKLLKCIGERAQDLGEIVEMLASREGDQERREYEKFRDLATRVEQLHRKVLGYFSKPSGEKPAAEKPDSEKPAGEKPAGEKPEDEEPEADKSSGKTPSARGPGAKGGEKPVRGDDEEPPLEGPKPQGRKPGRGEPQPEEKTPADEEAALPARHLVG
jgi:tetratricopeptide (TPR) repeat protein